MFVILSMDREEVRKRVTDRHKGDEQAADLVQVGSTSLPLSELQLFLFSLSITFVNLLVRMRKIQWM